MNELKYLFAYVLLILPLSLMAQEKDYEKEYQEFKDKANQEFEDFKRKNDREFYEFLKQNWMSFKLMDSEMPDVKPKPVESPVYEKKEDVSDVEVRIKEVKPAEERMVPLAEEKPMDFEWKNQPLSLIRKLSEVAEMMPKDDFQPLLSDSMRLQMAYYYANAADYSRFDFYGHRCNLYYKPQQLISTGSLDEKGIAEYWKSVSSDQQAVSLANQLEAYKSLLFLNDWAYLYLIRKATQILFENENDRLAYTWFVLVRGGYQAKIGHNAQELFLLLPTSHILYRTTYFPLNGQNYYVFDFDNNRESPETLKTYAGEYPENDRIINLYFTRPFRQKETLSYRRLKFEFKDEKFDFNISYHAGLVEFFNDLPMTDFRVLFSCPFSQTSYKSLVQHLKPVLKGRGELESVNLLLRFVQTAFKYKSDQEQFGHENYLFPEETLHYPYSDCEDRSVLFARLVKDLLDLPVVGLNYPDHVATAVQFSMPAKGSFILFEEKSYTVCDPTYVNATVGMIMLEYSRSKAEVIDFSHFNPTYLTD